MPAISASAPGKVILCGEHAVVYGQPAIALPVSGVETRCIIHAKPGNLRNEVMINDSVIGLKCNLEGLNPDNPLRKTVALTLSALSIDHLPSCEIRIHSTIPIGGGLGSSASVSVAIARAISAFIGHPLENESINDIAYEIEKMHHNTPSGIDNSVITYSKPLYFIKGKPIQWLEIKKPVVFLIANSGIKGSTRNAVNMVSENWQTAQEKYESLFSEIGKITKDMRLSLAAGSEKQMGQLMTRNHHLLQQLGISIPQIDQLVESSLSAGAFGAKLTGGGLGGNVIVLTDLDRRESISKALIKAGATKIFFAQIGTIL